MNTNLDEQELHRWLDGELNAAEAAGFESRLREDPALRAEAEAMKLLCADLKAHFPVVKDVPHPDFFNSQIQDRIAELEAADWHRQGERKTSSWLAWLSRPWYVLGGAAALVVAAGFLIFQAGDDTDNATTLNNTYAPDSEIQPRVYHSSDANATVLELDGVEDIPADNNVVGFKVYHPVSNIAQAVLSHSSTGPAPVVLAMNDQ